MSLALPAGWLDTGITITQTLSVDVAHRGCGLDPIYVEGFLIGDDASGAFTPGCGAGTLGYEILGSFAGGYTPGYSATYTRYIRSIFEGYGSRTVLDSVSGACAGTLFPPLTITKVAGPFRLGVTIVDKSQMRYALFGDALTVVTTTLPGGRSNQSFPYASPTNVGAGIGLSVGPHPPAIGGYPNCPFYTTSDVVQFSNLTYSVSGSSGSTSTGSIDLSNFPTSGNYLSHSSGTIKSALDMRGNNQWEGYYALLLCPPVVYDYSLSHRDASHAHVASQMDLYEGGLGLAPNTVTLSSSAAVTATRTIPTCSWDPASGKPFTLAARLTPAWCAAQDPQPYAADRLLKIAAPKPKDPHVAAGGWQAIGLAPTGSLPILNSSNAFAGTGGVACAGGNGTNWTVTGAGQAEITLASHWKGWSDKTTTKHDYYGDVADDVWGWGSYGYLSVPLTAPSNATVTMTLTVAVVTSGGYVNFTRTWTINATTGTHTYTIDLLFPNEGGPCYIERVDKIAFSGMSNGAWTFGLAALVTSNTGYVTVHPRAIGFSYSQDGQMVFSQWGTDPLISNGFRGTDTSTGYPSGTYNTKDDQNGIFFYDPQDGSLPGVGSYGGCPLMAQTLQALGNELAQVEGLGGFYNAGTIAADLSDSFGNVIGTDASTFSAVPTVPQASWLSPNLPSAAVPADTTTYLLAFPRMDTLALVPGTSGLFKLVVSLQTGMVVEGIAVNASLQRATPGSTLYIRKSWDGVARPGDALLGSTTTDGTSYFLFAVSTGLSPNNGVLSPFWLYLSEV